MSSSITLPNASRYHVPIMVEQILQHLHVSAHHTYLDATLGGGGHSEALLQHSSPDGKVIGLDRDPEAILEASTRLAPFGDRFQAVQSNYSAMRTVLDDLGIDFVDGLLLDAGVSSHQLDDADRGFSFRNSGPLDMRMGPDDNTPTLEQFLHTQDEESLAKILKEYGELKGSYRVAKAIISAFSAGKITNTGELSQVVVSAIQPGLMRRMNINPATLAFQALRIAINDELSHLREAVYSAVECVRPGGYIALMCFHSLEDRIVKQGFRHLANPCECPPGLPACVCHKQPRLEIVTRKPLKASDKECEANPRARSAVLRIAKVLPTT